MMPSNARIALCALALAGLAAGAIAADKLAIRQGDRIALVGGAFLEREQRSGRIETALTLLNPGVAFELRNFAWSGDTVWGEARAEFDTPKQGYERLIARAAEFAPTLVIVGYGFNESFKGEAGLPEFRTGLKRLLDDLAKGGARLALLSPAPGPLGAPLPDAAEANRNIKLYAKAIAEEAAARGAPYIDIYREPQAGEGAAAHTANGVHPTDFGYWRIADAFARAAGLPRAELGVEADFEKAAYKATARPLDGSAAPKGEEAVEPIAEKTETPKRARFRAKLQTLPYPAPPEGAPDAGEARLLASRRIVAKGLPPGEHRLVIDGVEAAQANAEQWASGVEVTRGPEFDQAEALRRAIVKKNELFFHRWRPQNSTYLFGFRKHEQGNNAVEIPQFDPLVREIDAEIARLSAPEARVYEFIPVSEASR